MKVNIEKLLEKPGIPPLLVKIGMSLQSSCKKSYIRLDAKIIKKIIIEFKYNYRRNLTGDEIELYINRAVNLLRKNPREFLRRIDKLYKNDITKTRMVTRIFAIECKSVKRKVMKLSYNGKKVIFGKTRSGRYYVGFLSEGYEKPFSRWCDAMVCILEYFNIISNRRVMQYE